METATWTELRAIVPLTEAAQASEWATEAFLAPLTDACLEVAPGGVVIEGADAPPGDEPVPAAGTVRVRVYVTEQEAEAARAHLAAVLAGFEGAELSSAPLEDGWQDRWKAWFKGFEISPRLAVRPPWEADKAPAGQAVVVIEPGMAFGTGQHETTRLCLETVDAVYAGGQGPARVLDVGCGTGILAIGAALMGAAEVIAIDNDPEAVTVAAENVALNGVEAQVKLSTTPVEDVPGEFPLVLANIMAHTLIALRDALLARTSADGLLVLSGVLWHQAEEVVAAFEAAGARLLERRQMGEWVRLDLARA